MNAAFTPAPWGYEYADGDWLITYGLDLHHGPRALGKVFDYAGEFQEEDARLIAAAPELYAALDALLGSRGVFTPGSLNYLSPLEQQGIDALAKASAGEAGTAATVKQGAVHEHATAESGDARTPSPSSRERK